MIETIYNDNSDIRFLVARLSKAPACVLKRLSKDSSWQVRREVAKRHDVPLRILYRLKKDKNKVVASAAECEISRIWFCYCLFIAVVFFLLSRT